MGSKKRRRRPGGRGKVALPKRPPKRSASHPVGTVASIPAVPGRSRPNAGDVAGRSDHGRIAIPAHRGRHVPARRTGRLDALLQSDVLRGLLPLIRAVQPEFRFLVYAALAALFMVLVAVVLVAIYGQPWPAIVIGAGSLAGWLGARSRRNSRQRKRRGPGRGAT